MVTKPSLMMHTPLSPVELTLRYSLFRTIPTKLVWFHQVALAGMASLGQVEATIEHDTESAILTFKGELLSFYRFNCWAKVLLGISLLLDRSSQRMVRGRIQRRVDG